MSTLYRTFIAGLCCSVLFIFPAAIQADTLPTAQGAHDFFALLASKHLLRSGKERYAKNYQNDGACKSSWDDNDEDTPGSARHIVVDWSSITSAVNMDGVSGEIGYSITFMGAVTFETAEGKAIKKGMRMYGSDGVTRERIYKAGEFLRKHCDTLSATGF